MKLEDFNLNGIAAPLGFDARQLVATWHVAQAKGTVQRSAHVTVLRESDNSLMWESGPDASHLGTVLDFAPQPRTAYLVKLTVTDDAGDTATVVCPVETGKMDEPWHAQWISPQREDTFHPALCKRFCAPKKVQRARLYVCGVGLYEAYLNGCKIGEECLTPYCNDYKQALQVQTYDVTEMLGEENTLSVWLGNGWYKGRFGGETAGCNNYGDRFAAIAELHLTYDDGTTELVCTDESWRYTRCCVTQSGIYDGETVDMTALPGKEKQVEIIEAPGILCDRYSPPVHIQETLSVVQVLHTPAGETVLDFGQNHAGWLAFRCAQPRGTVLHFAFGEILQNGNFYQDNYRSATGGFTYTADGEEREVRQHFTYYGFRYVRVTGWQGELCAADFRAPVLYSALSASGSFACGNESVNRLYQNVLWGQKSNFIDLPTDCPQRDERTGWTADAQVFSATACLNMDCRAFYDKFLRDLRSEQIRFGGAIPNYIPNFGTLEGYCSVWGDAGTILPWNLYLSYGDTAALARHYPMMRDWVDFIAAQDEKRGAKHLFDWGFHFGDWLALDGVTAQSMKGGTPDDYIASVYWHHSAQLVSEAAAVLQYGEDAKKYAALAQAIKAAVLREYFTPSGRLAVDHQAAYVIALRFGLCPDKQKVIDGLEQRFEKDGHAITCGFVGAPVLCQTLSENGLPDLAYHFLLNERFPGWMYCVGLGATTIWERWNSMLADGTCSGTAMNSFNHYSYGSVAEFLYTGVAGMQRLTPGWTRVRFCPAPDARLGSCKASYRSASGTWESEWRILQNGGVQVRFTVPFGCTATACLPDGKTVELTAGTFETVCTGGRDWRCLYTKDTLLCDMCGDARVQTLFGEKLPQAAWMVQAAAGGDKEAGNFTLRKMEHLFFMGLTPELVAPLAQEILCLQKQL